VSGIVVSLDANEYIFRDMDSAIEFALKKRVEDDIQYAKDLEAAELLREEERKKRLLSDKDHEDKFISNYQFEPVAKLFTADYNFKEDISIL